MAQKSKAYRAAVALLEEGKFYEPTEAVALVKQTGSKKFDATVEVAFRLGVDPRKADQMLRSVVVNQPTNAEAQYLMGRARLGAGNYVDSVHYLTPTDDNHRQTERMKALSIFGAVNDEVGEIIVADVDKERVRQLLDPDRVALRALVAEKS